MLYKLTEYHRPAELQTALALLSRDDVFTVALAGGTTINGNRDTRIQAVVDLADLGFNHIERNETSLSIGATVRLQTLVDVLGDVAGGILSETAYRVAGAHIRNQATIGGLLGSDDVHSPLSVALAALGARVEITGHENTWLWPFPAAVLHRQLITRVLVEESSLSVEASYEQTARTHADQPIVCTVSTARFVDDETVATRTVVGGLMDSGLALMDFTVSVQRPDISAVDNIALELGDTPLISDFLGGEDYRRAVAPVLARRALSSALAKLNLTVEG